MLELGSVFQQVGALLAVCAVLGVVATLLRQPMIVGFIAFARGGDGLHAVVRPAARRDD